MEHKGRYLWRLISLTLAFVLISSMLSFSSLAERPPWDCPECGRKGNTGNFCGNCAHPAPKTNILANASKTTLTLWGIWIEGDLTRSAFERAVAEFEKEYPQIKIKWQTFDSDSYRLKINNMKAKELPDIFFTWAGIRSQSFVDTGKLYCLDDAYADYSDVLPDVMTQNAVYNGKRYGVPLLMNYVTLFANMDLLAKAGWDHVPKTYKDLIDCCAALKKKGIIPFGCSGRELWCISEYFEPILLQSIGYETLKKIYTGKESWNNQAIATAVDRFQEMIKKGYFDPKGIQLGNEEVKADFLAGKYAFYQNGSWNCGEINDAKRNIKAAYFPVMDNKKATYKQIIGGTSDCLAVSAKGKNPELAARAAFELGRKYCHYAYFDGCGLYTWTPDYKTDKVKKLVNSAAKLAAGVDGMVLFGDCMMSTENYDAYYDYLGQVYSGEIDGAGFIKAMSEKLW